MFENTVSVMFVLYTQLMKDAVVRAEIFLFQILDHSSITKKSKNLEFSIIQKLQMLSLVPQKTRISVTIHTVCTL